MTIYQINCFLILAEQLNYTKAAEVLNITQPALSKIISALENELNITLFYRDKRTVKLTSVGECFVIDAKSMLSTYNSTILSAKALKDGVKGELKVGFVGHSMASIIPTVFRSFRKSIPDADIKIFDYGHHMVAAEALNNGVVDVMLSLDRYVSQCDDVESKQLFISRYCLAVSKYDKRADAKMIDTELLAKADYVVPGRIMMSSSTGAQYNSDSLTHVSAYFGFVPHIAYQTASLYDQMILINSGLGVGIFGEHIKYIAPSDICFMVIKDMPTFHVGVMSWKEANTNPLIPYFIQTVDAIVGDGKKKWSDLMTVIHKIQP